ncbi:ImmA/IrrE family metallo-endopeptidase [Thetidibacter halocola]|nr:ImmA/IrrE family metallo-endopeptidase [Thetidibacter halocola]
MPKAYPAYPYVEPVAVDPSEDEIERLIRDMLSQSPAISLRDGGTLDPLCRALNVDVEYAAPPNEILLDVPLDGRAVIWLPRNGRPRHDRLMLAMGLGHWMLHVPNTRQLHPKAGVQALYKPASPRAMTEARRFAYQLLMPQSAFISLWYEGRAMLTAETLNVPTQAVYDRAKDLMLTAEPGAA